MTPQEYAAWRDETLKSQRKWMMDVIHNKHDDCWFYFGGQEKGKFIMITDNTLSLGNYKYAYPHIGDAQFEVKAEKFFNTNEEAWKYLFERAGIPFLLSLYSNI
jgi:hypothetical protein